MKPIVLLLAMSSFFTTSLLAQKHLSIAPTYWFDYGTLSYNAKLLGAGITVPISTNQINSSAGLTAHYHFTPKWDASVGIRYSWISTHVNDPSDPNITYSGKRTFHAQAFELPAFINYRPSIHRFSPYLSAGTFLTKNKTDAAAPININGSVGIGVDYRINSGLSLLIQPTASYLFTRLANTTQVEYDYKKSYSFGLQTQLIWHL
ncbi:outer membrane beta-barrel protein [Spirosoma pomorum]